ncbi:MAG TPA: hypothetical protein VMU10_01350, partial [Desulfomonilia bacterium]|nr:hypothetical protein [Desulfomonilia bacterium]
RINPRAVSSIASLAAIAREEGAALDSMSVRIEHESCVLDWAMIKAYRVQELLKATDAVLKRMIINVVSRMIDEPRGIDAIQVEAALDVLKGASRAHAIRRKVKLIREGDLLFVHRISTGPHYAKPVNREGLFFIQEIKKTVYVILPQDGSYDLQLRSSMRGDRIRGRKVSDRLSKMKVPCALRPFWPVLASREGVVAVAADENAPAGFKVVWEQAHGR